MDFDIPDELQLLARTVRDFVETRLQPIEKEVEERDEIPGDVMREMAALGFFGLPSARIVTYASSASMRGPARCSG